MMQLPPAEDAEEAGDDHRPIHYSLDLLPATYRRLLTEQYRRRLGGKKMSMREIILALLDKHLPPDPQDGAP